MLAIVEAITAGAPLTALLRRVVYLMAPPLALLLLLPAVWLVHHIYFDRSRLPDVEPFIRFEVPTIGQVYDARGKRLIELAR